MSETGVYNKVVKPIISWSAAIVATLLVAGVSALFADSAENRVKFAVLERVTQQQSKDIEDIKAGLDKRFDKVDAKQQLILDKVDAIWQRNASHAP